MVPKNDVFHDKKFFRKWSAELWVKFSKKFFRQIMVFWHNSVSQQLENTIENVSARLSVAETLKS